MNITTQQKKYLRGIAHNLKPVITVGDKGLTPGLLTELKTSLEHHELIKIKVRCADRKQRDSAILELAAASGAEVIGRIGNIASLYKARKDRPKITLP